jgi:hypothetical protein
MASQIVEVTMELKHVRSFEGSPRPSDLFQPVLLVDSGMLPFLQEDWFEVAQRVMRPNPRVYVHDRETYTLNQQIPVTDEQSGTQPGQRAWDTCISCGSKEDPYFDTMTAYHHPPDAYFGLLISALISGAALMLGYSLAGTPNQFRLLSPVASFVLVVGFVYYAHRSTSAEYQLVFCPSCRKKYINRKFLRIAIITALILISVVVGSDEYPLGTTTHEIV